MQASHYSGISCCGAWALGAGVLVAVCSSLVVVIHGLSCSEACGICVLWIGRQVLNHWTIREVPFLSFFFGWTTKQVELPWPGIKPALPAVEIRNLNHWTTSENYNHRFLILVNNFSPDPIAECSFFKLFIFSWRIIALHYCVGFYQTSTWISHGYTYALLPTHPTPLGCYRALVGFLSFFFTMLTLLVL